MINKKVLILSTYPIAEPLHGGQKRTKAITEYYKNIFTDVKFVAVFHKEDYDSYDKTDMPIEDPSLIKQIEKHPFLGDILAGEALYKDQAIKQKLSKLLEAYQPDVIQLEQIYAYFGLAPLLNALSINPMLVLSSQNVETQMKAELYKDLSLPVGEKDKLLAQIREGEQTVSQRAKLVIAVSENDANEHRRMGARRCIVIPNGISKVTSTEAALQHWREFKREHSIDHLITFVGSAHPPNLVGFEALVGTDLSFLPANACLMLAGGVSNYIQQEYGSEKPALKKFWRKAWPLGRLSDDNLAGLIEESEVIMLPIVSGGGSNLKTAEAILADKKIVSTRLAFRSFEKYSELPNIYFADNEHDFKQAIETAISSSKINRNEYQLSLAQKVQWRYCLRPLGEELDIVVNGRLKVELRRIRHKLAQLKRLYSKN